ncbi:MAG TPA: LptE family protein [Thermoanaerobaculia bacterium]|nr:LptE family protein [Thermoanaerobaculia bacterium]
MKHRVARPHPWLRTLILPAVLALPLLGCGYALVGRASSIPAGIERIYVDPLVNATRRSEVEQVLTRAIAEELVTRKRFVLVNAAEGADAVLSGEVLLFEATPLSFDDQGRATEYQITIQARMSFRDRQADEVLWANDRYVYTEAYPVDPSEETYFDREILAIEEAAGRFARTMVIDLLEGF